MLKGSLRRWNSEVFSIINLKVKNIIAEVYAYDELLAYCKDGQIHVLVLGTTETISSI